MKYLLTLFSICSLTVTTAQSINWSAINESQNETLYLNYGYDYGVTTQIGYGCQLNWLKPIMLSADVAFPMGNELFDDFKIRIGGQMPVLRFNNYLLTVKINSVYRRHQTSLVTASSFGSETALLFGIYKSRWHLAAELGYDNSGVTYLQHTQRMKEYYPLVTDGWYASTGGNFFYGVQVSKTIGQRVDFSARIGASKARGKDQSALIPMYFQVGAVYRF